MAIEFSFDSVVANAGRLRILAALARVREAEFVHLRQLTRMTDGNLSAHAKRLAEAGLISIEKRFRDEKPVTSFRITQAGKYAIQAHARQLLAAVEEGDEGLDDEWVD
jgi:DNA-binding MarR family transcriptional regulator